MQFAGSGAASSNTLARAYTGGLPCLYKKSLRNFNHFKSPVLLCVFYGEIPIYFPGWLRIIGKALHGKFQSIKNSVSVR